VLVAEQRETISAQQQQIAALQAKVEELERRSKRQAAPFSKGKPVEHPKPPGRKKGEGPFTYRQAPSEEEWS